MGIILFDRRAPLVGICDTLASYRRYSTPYFVTFPLTAIKVQAARMLSPKYVTGDLIIGDYTSVNIRFKCSTKRLRF